MFTFFKTIFGTFLLLAVIDIYKVSGSLSDFKQAVFVFFKEYVMTASMYRYVVCQINSILSACKMFAIFTIKQIDLFVVCIIVKCYGRMDNTDILLICSK